MKITYRPEIDGLRAIAVSAVILYHAQITILGYQPFAGGFIGVDIFFVISGYLITLIILTELITTGSFSFKLFYERRIRRLFPEVGWNPVKKIFMDRKNKLFLKAELKEDITTSYKVYKDRSKSSFELLDSINNENIHRVYPHKIFCKTRCITHNKENIFYSDSNHPSKSGAEMINNLIMDEIKKIELKK